MARDEEFRKVAEDLRALSRSLARDFWQAADQARRHGRPPGSVIGHGLRQMAGEARRGFSGSGYRSRHGGYRGWGAPPGPRVSPRTEGRYGPWGPPWRNGGWAGPPPRRVPSRPPRPAPPPVRRRWDATTVLGTLGVLFGSAWLLGALHVIRVPVEAVVAAGLMLLGVAVIVTARTDWSLSRHSWPLWIGGALLVVLVAASSTLGIGSAFGHVSFGDMSRNATAGRTVYGGFGNLTVDAGAMTGGQSLRVQSAAGQTDVITPPGAPLEVHARVLAGRVCVDGTQVASGVEATVDHTFAGSGSGGPPLIVDVHQLAGDVTIGGTGCSRS